MKNYKIKSFRNNIIISILGIVIFLVIYSILIKNDKKNKKVLLIIGGGISAYKTLDLIRLLKKNNFQIKTILTKSGKKFVTPLSIVSLSGGKVYDEIYLYSSKESEIDHISLSRWADLNFSCSQQLQIL